MRGRINCLRCEDQAEQEISMWETDSGTEELQQGQVVRKEAQGSVPNGNDRPPYYFNVATFSNVIFKDRA